MARRTKKRPKLVDVRALGRKRWQGVADQERSELMSAAAKSRWAGSTEEERKAYGAKLAAARAKKRAKKA